MDPRDRMGELIGSYPRIRPPLSDAHTRIYAEQYRLNREGARVVEGLAQRLEQWMHRKVAAASGGPVLELGAGTLNHVRFEPPGIPYDVVEPFVELYRGRPESGRIRSFYSATTDVPTTELYGRVISIAVLEHMTDLPRELAEAARRLRDDGVFQAGIPSEGGILWWAGWRFSTGLSYYLRTRLDYGVVMRHEHVNSAKEILALVRWLFADVRLARFPLPAHHLSFYTYVEARGPRKSRCDALLNVHTARTEAT